MGNNLIQGINNLSNEIHENNVAKGFYENPKNIGEMLCLIHSEVSEALEADRKSNFADWTQDVPPIIHPEQLDDNEYKKVFESAIKNTFEDELADILIRVMDLAAFKGIDIEYHIKAKMRYNSLREKCHGKRY